MIKSCPHPTFTLSVSLFLITVSLLFPTILAASECTSIHNATLTLRLSKPGGNPYAGRRAFVNPKYRANVDSSLRTATPKQKEALRRLRNAPTAVWLDSIKSVSPQSTSSLSRAFNTAARNKPAPLVTFVVYNLPNRDCAAGASAGEICCSRRGDGSCNPFASSGSCEAGLSIYRNSFIGRLTSSVKKFCGRVPMAFIIEPDSLPNLVTNLGNPNCGSRATQASYREGIKFAVKKISAACPRAALYLDAAHGGWLGWENNAKGFARAVGSLGIASLLRGFVVNVANFQEMGIVCPEVGWCNGGKNSGHKCCRVDSCRLSGEFNPGHTALNYVVSLNQFMQQTIRSFKPKFIIDTGRNGVGNARKDCSNWCNIRRAGVGLPFTTKTAVPSLIDAYLWVKPPGESDGCTEILPNGGRCPRFDGRCRSGDSIGSMNGEPRAPEAGSWFNYQVKLLATNGKKK